MLDCYVETYLQRKLQAATIDTSVSKAS
jgi:hypothetical protein